MEMLIKISLVVAIIYCVTHIIYIIFATGRDKRNTEISESHLIGQLTLRDEHYKRQMEAKTEIAIMEIIENNSPYINLKLKVEKMRIRKQIETLTKRKKKPEAKLDDVDVMECAIPAQEVSENVQ